ncbi:proliferating cell nuclear antigen, partial [Tanacetum coccineum]
CEFFKAKEVEDKYVEVVHAKVHTRLIKTISSMTDFERICMGVDDSVYFNECSSECTYLAAGSVLEVARKLQKGNLIPPAMLDLLDTNAKKTNPWVFAYSTMLLMHEHGTFYPFSDDEEATIIEMETPVSLTFALRNMNFYHKANTMSSQKMTISFSSELPVVVEYMIAKMGYLRFYLAPKIEEDEEMNGHHAAPPQAETTKQPEKRPTTEPKTNREPKRHVMKIEYWFMKMSELKPK